MTHCYTPLSKGSTTTDRHAILKKKKKKKEEEKKRFIVCGSLAVCCWLLIYIIWQQEPSGIIYLPVSVKPSETWKESSRFEYVINQAGCRIPSMSLLGPAVASFINRAFPANCEYRKRRANDSGSHTRRQNIRLPALVVDDQTSLSIDKTALGFYNTRNISCNYRSFFRRNDGTNDSVDNIDDENIFSQRTALLYDNEPTNVTSEFDEFLRVTCEDGGATKKKFRKPFYKDLFAFVPLKKNVEERCDRIDRTRNFDRRTRLNVVFLGIDALSRLNFQRQMPASHRYLVETMAAIEMFGFNKVGDNTFPNLVPLLTGMSVDELQKFCWNSTEKFFDACPFIWDFFRDNGYRTVFAEDTPFIGVFNYLKRGFLRQPTDYYLRPFYVQAETEIGFNKPGNCLLCLGSRLSLSVLLNYASKHIRTWKQRQKFFGFFWSTSFTHDNFNLHVEGDQTVLDFLKSFHKSHTSNNTVLMVISDHGLRWGAFRETYQGHLEERLPLLMFVLPDWFKRKYELAVRSLRHNQAMLSTYFDLHDTVLDFVDLQRLEDSSIANRERIAYSRSQSLFVAVSTNRTCSDAGIPKNYCTCHDDVQTLETNDTRSVALANDLVDHINVLLKGVPECAPLAVDQVQRATVESSTVGGAYRLNGVLSNYVIIVRLSPGNGLFEGTLRHNEQRTKYEVVGQVSRINTYGSQSFCVNDANLKLYCYCRH